MRSGDGQRRAHQSTADPLPIRAVISDTLRARGWQARLDAALVMARWVDVVGAPVAAHCHPLRLEDDGTLLVTTDSAAWATQLTYLRGMVLDRLAAVCGPGLVRAIAVRTDEARHRPRQRP